MVYIMKKLTRIISAVLCAVMLGGCSRIADNPNSVETSTSTASSETSTVEIPQENPPKEFQIVSQTFISKMEAEKGTFNGTALGEDGEELQNSDGGGFVRLKKGQHLTEVVTAKTTQFYRVVILARANDSASVKLRVGDTVEGMYSIPNTDGEFQLFAVDNLYLSVGMSALTFTSENGTADIDCVVVENSRKASDDLYKVGTACVAENASVDTAMLMRNLAELYGKYTLTAQNVSCGSNAEIDAVYTETGKYPVIRASELALALKDDAHSAEVIKNDIALAKEWHERGGICSYSWHWYSPNPIRGTNADDFALAEALDGVEPTELGMMNEDGIQLQLDNELMTQEAADLIHDLDELAEVIKQLDAENIPILFEPIPHGDTDLFWWGGDAESYQKLWILVFTRLGKYNGLKNLIWVWNNSDFSYYPGDKYVDIIGQSFYENSQSAFAGRFTALSSDAATGRKILAVTECDILTSIDFMNRDNAMWLWTAPAEGEYTIDKTGAFSEKYTKKAALRYAYDCNKCVTLDEMQNIDLLLAGSE